MTKILRKTISALQRNVKADIAAVKPATLSARDPLAYAAALKALG
jgi:hypothetical protein